MLTVDRGPQVIVTGGRSLSPDAARLAQLRGQLDSLRLKYTDQHPDVSPPRPRSPRSRRNRSTPAPARAASARPASRRSPMPSTISSRSAWSMPRHRRLGAAYPGRGRERGEPPRTDRAIGAERVGPGAGSRPRLRRAEKKLPGAGGAPRGGADRRHCRHPNRKDPVPHCRSAAGCRCFRRNPTGRCWSRWCCCSGSAPGLPRRC